jgi:pyrimidine operon attenuation protein/uracil phosphoribosyltransferase
MQRRQILDAHKLSIILQRLALEIAENHGHFQNTAIIGLQPRGIIVARRLYQKLKEITGNENIKFGELDSTFYRDDFRRGSSPLVPNSIKLDFIVEDKKVILIDDVLYTGRSVRSALNALADFGRPLKTELLVLIDRVHNRELPIEPNYVGEKIDTRAHDKVEVLWKENGAKDEVWIITKN